MLLRLAMTGATFLLTLCGSVSAQIKGVKWTDDPRATLEVRSVVEQGAPLCGQPGLKTALQNGTVLIRQGQITGAHAITLHAPNALSPTAPVIIVGTGQTPAQVLVQTLHEWKHIQEGHPAAPSGQPAEADFRQQACQEASAHCAVLCAFGTFFINTEKKLPCELRNKILEDLSWEQWWCNGATLGTFGPPPTPSCSECTGLYELPCS